jgi:DNA-binding NtrC family response regulator
VITITLPPLRERTGDIPHLVHFFLGRIGEEMGKTIGMSEEGMAALERWRWPGNVRELENVLRRAAVFAKGAILPADIGPPVVT